MIGEQKFVVWPRSDSLARTRGTLCASPHLCACDTPARGASCVIACDQVCLCVCITLAFLPSEQAKAMEQDGVVVKRNTHTLTQESMRDCVCVCVCVQILTDQTHTHTHIQTYKELRSNKTYRRANTHTHAMHRRTDRRTQPNIQADTGTSRHTHTG